MIMQADCEGTSAHKIVSGCLLLLLQNTLLLCLDKQEGESVEYPGLEVHPHYERFNSLRNPGQYGYGGMCAQHLNSFAVLHLILPH